MSSARSLGPRARLRSDEFRLLRDLVNDHAGLTFDESALYVFERRLAERVAQLDLRGFDEYYKFLRFNVRGLAELEEAIDAITTKETYFFRQDYQLRAFCDEVVPRIAQAQKDSRRLTVWSAGCSSGEEAYTLAILLLEHPLLAGFDIKVIGSDLSRSSIAFARRGVYRESSFRTTPEELRRRYFEADGTGHRVVDSVRRLCHFGNLNLLDGQRAAVVGRVDAVFCRNVLIYFDVRSRRKVIDNLHQRLVPGGFLLLGHSESLINVTTAFELVHLREDLVYRKPALGAQT